MAFPQHNPLKKKKKKDTPQPHDLIPIIGHFPSPVLMLKFSFETYQLFIRLLFWNASMYSCFFRKEEAIATYTKLQQWKKEESERLRGEGDRDVAYCSVARLPTLI